MPGSKKWFRVLVWLAGVTGLILFLGLVLAKSLLCVDSGPQPAEVIIIPGGGYFDRAPHAAELFKAGAARKIIICGRWDCEENRDALLAAGVTASAIAMECQSASTRQNAEFARPLLEAAGVKKAIIVTTWFHSRRALNTFRSVMPGIQFVSEPAYYTERFEPGERVAGIYQEYFKVVWYFVRWGISPMGTGK